MQRHQSLVFVLKKDTFFDKNIYFSIIPPYNNGSGRSFTDEKTIIAVQNDNGMRTLDENYALLEKLVNEERIYLDPMYDFGRVCRLLGVRRPEMDALLERELGLDGASLFAELRAALPERLERKYGLKCFFQEV